MAVPSSIQFRFKAEKLNNLTAPSQSLFVSNTGSNGGAVQFAVVLEYTGSRLTSGSYLGSSLNPEYQYATLKFIHPGNNTSASIYLPFYNEGWWSVMVTREAAINNVYTLYAKNNLYNIDTGNQIGFQASASCSGSLDWAKFGNAYIPGSGSSTVLGKVYTQGSGSFQEVRYYDTVINEQPFNDYVMNPHSIEGNGLEGSYNSLFFRGALGGELYTGSTSIHPSVEGSAPTASFVTSATTTTSVFSYTGSYSFVANREYFHLDEPAVGIQNRVTSKIRKGSSDVYGNVLSNQRSLQQEYPVSQSYTSDINYVEVGFSPQNEINDDITQQLGHFNIGEYIGDPRQVSQSTYAYPDLAPLNSNYFKKYSNSYNIQDYLRLIKFYDNSLFKLLKDFAPAKSSITTGAIIKQHLLERNRQRPAQVTYTQPEYTASVTSLPRDYETGSIETFEGGPGGSVNKYLNTSQSWNSSILTVAGLVDQVNSSGYEFYNGEYSGSEFPAQLVYNLNTAPLLNNVSGNRLSTIYEDVDYQSDGYRPVNFNLITASLAYYAPVQDSNYSSGSLWSQGRYEGSKLTSATYNTYTPGDISYGQTAVIDSYSNYVGYFDFIESADPEYPGGGVINLKYLVHTDGTVIGLTAANQNLLLVESTFKASIPASATFFGQTYSNTNTIANIAVIEGGASYETILVKSGSSTGFGFTYIYTAKTTGDTSVVGYDFPALTSASLVTLVDSGSIGGNQGWLQGALTASNSASNELSYVYNGVSLKFYDRVSNTYPVGQTIPYSNTYLPIKFADFIRFGKQGVAQSASLDYSFQGQGLYRIAATTIATSSIGTSSLSIVPQLTNNFPSVDLSSGPSIDSQNFRIFRRVPNETKVVVSPMPGYLQNGILVPSNFNPSVDPLALARKVGLIT
jgi:hypothetical protein